MLYWFFHILLASLGGLVIFSLLDSFTADEIKTTPILILLGITSGIIGILLANYILGKQQDNDYLDD